MEYVTSKNEINRRKNAYTILSISLMVGLLLASEILNFPIPVIGYLLVFCAIFLIGVFSLMFFHSLFKIRISLSDKYLNRFDSRLNEEYLLTRVKKVKVKWKTNDTVREIYIWLADGKSVFITGLDNFEQFKKDLLSRLEKNVNILESHEPLDFDHPMFYPVLGLIISAIGVFIIKTIVGLNYQGIQILLLSFSVYIFILGTYFIIARPVSKRIGEKYKISDYIFGCIMISMSALILILLLSQFTPLILSQ
jgi:hypothetical protein